MFAEKIRRLFNIVSTHETPKIGDSLVIYKPQDNGGYLWNRITPVRVKRIVGNFWKICASDAHTYFLWVLKSHS